MGLYTFTAAGGGFMVIGAWECLSQSAENSNPPSPLTEINNTASPSPVLKIKRPRSTALNFIVVAILSILFIWNSLVSLFNARDLKDPVGLILQLQVVAIACLFFLYSVVGLLVNSPSSILDLIALFGFLEEFLLFYRQTKDPSGIENRYFDLLLVPILICVISTLLQLKPTNSRFNYGRFARGVGLFLQGTWFVQMGLSFYSNLITHGCTLHEKSRGNYTIRCKGHPEYHRARAIATLQFNCHLALVVILILGFHSIIAAKRTGDFAPYRPLGAEMQQISHFTLDSDEDEDNSTKQNALVNGYASHE